MEILIVDLQKYSYDYLEYIYMKKVIEKDIYLSYFIKALWINFLLMLIDN